MSMAWAQERLKAARNEKGMTLIELLAVIVILGIIIAIAAVVIVGQFDKAKETSDKTSLKIVTDAAQRYIMDNPTIKIDANPYPISMAQLVEGGYIKEAPINSEKKKLESISVSYKSTTDKTLIVDPNWEK